MYMGWCGSSAHKWSAKPHLDAPSPFYLKNDKLSLGPEYY